MLVWKTSTRARVLTVVNIVLCEARNQISVIQLFTWLSSEAKQRLIVTYRNSNGSSVRVPVRESKRPSKIKRNDLSGMISRGLKYNQRYVPVAALHASRTVLSLPDVASRHNVVSTSSIVIQPLHSSISCKTLRIYHTPRYEHTWAIRCWLVIKSRKFFYISFSANFSTGSHFFKQRTGNSRCALAMRSG